MSSIVQNEDSISLKKTKDINGNNSVASSLNSIVKKQFVNMTEQYNIYASAITEMENKIKALKSIMLSDTFFKNCQHMAICCDTDGIESNTFSSKKNNKKPNVTSNSYNDPKNTILNSSESNSDSLNNDYFTPKQSDSLFWCFYILCNGFNSYEYEKNYFTAEQQFKIQTVEKVKRGENKQILKDNKISKKYFESGLMENIKPKILHALCLFYGINVFYVHNNTYYDINVNVEKPTSVIRYNTETHNYSVSVTTTPNICEYIEKIKENYLKIDNLEKPIRTITSYSVGELVNICNKLDISIINDSNKKKTKTELYSNILQKL